MPEEADSIAHQGKNYDVNLQHLAELLDTHEGIQIKPELDPYWGSSAYLKEAMLNEGSECFVKEILSMWPTRKMAALEECRLHNEFDVCINPTFYNRAKAVPNGYSTAGTKLSDEIRNNMSEAHKNLKHTPSHCRAISDAQKLRYSDPKERQKARELSTGRPMTESTKKKLSDIALNRPPMSQQTKDKISKVCKGRTHTDETKKKMSESTKKRYNSYRIVNPEGKIYILEGGLHKFAHGMGVCPSTFIKIANGHQPKLFKLLPMSVWQIQYHSFWQC